MKFYIQIDQDGYITDCIEYPYKDYIEVEFNIPLPSRFISGEYHYVGNNLYEHVD